MVRKGVEIGMGMGAELRCSCGCGAAVWVGGVYVGCGCLCVRLCAAGVRSLEWVRERERECSGVVCALL